MDDDPTKPIPAQDGAGDAPTAPTEPLAPGADPFGVTAAAASLPPEDAVGAGNPVVAPAPGPVGEPEPGSRRWLPLLIIGGTVALLAIAALAFLPGMLDAPVATTPSPTSTTPVPTPVATTPPPAEPGDGGTDPAPPPPPPPPPPPAPEPTTPPEPTPEPTSPAPEPTPTP